MGGYWCKGGGESRGRWVRVVVGSSGGSVGRVDRVWWGPGVEGVVGSRGYMGRGEGA